MSLSQYSLETGNMLSKSAVKRLEQRLPSKKSLTLFTYRVQLLGKILQNSKVNTCDEDLSVCLLFICSGRPRIFKSNFEFFIKVSVDTSILRF